MKNEEFKVGPGMAEAQAIKETAWARERGFERAGGMPKCPKCGRVMEEEIDQYYGRTIYYCKHCLVGPDGKLETEEERFARLAEIQRIRACHP